MQPTFENPISRANSIEVPRSSLEKPLSLIIEEFFAISSSSSPKNTRLKSKLLRDLRLKILHDKIPNDPQTALILENYFANSSKFEDIDQEFIKEMIFNGYNLSDKLLNIFRFKNFKLADIPNPLNGNKALKIDFEKYLRNESSIVILDYEQTQKFVNSIIESVKLFLKDNSRDSKKEKLLFLQLNDDFVALKPAGFMNFINNDKLSVSINKNQEIIPFKEYKFSKELSNSLKAIQDILNKDYRDSEISATLIRSSLDGSLDMIRDSSNSFEHNRPKSTCSACFVGIINIFKNLFKKDKSTNFNKTPNTSIQVASDLRCMGRSDIMF